MAKKLSLSVRSLVEFVLRSGDIDMRFTGGERMQDGARAHRRLQKAAPAGYTPEVTLKYSFEYRGFEILLEGRADGVIESGSGGVTVDEIKSTVRPLSSLSEGSNPVFWAQAECYAFMLARTRGLDEVTVRVTYCGAGENSDEGVRFFEKRPRRAASSPTSFTRYFDRYIDLCRLSSMTAPCGATPR
jgi:DNA excision repair protein ERCC-2